MLAKGNENCTDSRFSLGAKIPVWGGEKENPILQGKESFCLEGKITLS